MRVALIVCLAVLPRLAPAQIRDYPRDIFNTAQPVSGTTPFPDYDPHRLSDLYGKRHEIELQMFDVVNEAALRRDKTLESDLKLYAKSLCTLYF